MAGDLVEQCSKLALTSEENDVVDLGDSIEDANDDNLSLRLVDQILTAIPLNFDVGRRTLLHIWSLKDGVIIRSMGSNLFLFQFFHWRDRDTVLNGRPWCFENKLLVLQEIDREKQPADMEFNFLPFWIRLYNLFVGYRSDEKVRTIAKALRDVLEIEEDFLNINPFRRVRVWLDVTKPLKRFQMIRLKNNTTLTIPLKYERLPHFCFMCGLMCHTEKDCSHVSDEETEVGYGWGLNIKASPRKGLSKNNEEVNALRLKKSVFVVKPKITTALQRPYTIMKLEIR